VPARDLFNMDEYGLSIQQQHHRGLARKQAGTRCGQVGLTGAHRERCGQQQLLPS
jgi:hypothetical protein